MFELNIHGIGNERYRIELGEDETKFKNTTIKEVKEKLIKEKALPIEVEHVRFIFSGKQLDDGQTLESCNILNKSTLMSVIRVPGGKI